MKKHVLLTISLCMLMFTQAVSAIAVATLYQAEIPVPSQSQEAKEQAIQQGFLQVLRKVSGNPQVENNSLIKANLGKAEYYVQEFSYEAATTSASQFILKVTFDTADINRLLKQADVKRWKDNRPLLLVWLVTENQQTNEVEIIGSESPTGFSDAMKQQAEENGLPLIFPLMDVNEVNTVSANDIANKSIIALEKAAARYSPDGMLLGKMLETPEGIQSEWTLIVGDKEYLWKIISSSSAEVTTKIINNVLTTLNPNAVEENSQATDEVAATAKLQTYILKINNVSKPTDLDELSDYLKKLNNVQDVNLVELSGDEAKFSLVTSLSKDDLIKSIDNSRRLNLLSENVDNVIDYELQH